MPNCYPDTLLIARPNVDGRNQCGPSCGVNGGYGSCPPGIGPRRKRDAVIEEIKEFVIGSLGGPVLDLEIDEQQLDIAIKTTLKYFEYYAPREFFTYYTFQATPGQSVYEMPPEVGYIRKVSYKETAEYPFQSSDLGGSIPLDYFYPGSQMTGGGAGGFVNPVAPIWGDAGSWTVYKSYERLYSRVSSGLGGWEWVNGYRHIKLYPIPTRPSRVIVHYMQKCKDWDEVHLAMLEGTLAQTKMMLGLIRRKYTNMPGPGGGTQLDGAQMYQEGKEEFEKWKEDLIYRWGDILPIGTG